MRKESCRNCNEDTNYNKYIYPSWNHSHFSVRKGGITIFYKNSKKQKEIYSALKNDYMKQYFLLQLNLRTRKGDLVLYGRLKASEVRNIV